MSTNDDAERYLADLNTGIRSIASSAHDLLTGLGCSSYVKTIYVGYDIDGEMVAAMYGHANHVEIALALPEDAEGHILIDASHLTWRTLPVAAVLRSDMDLPSFQNLAEEACRRVRHSDHDVLRDSDYFFKARRERGFRQ
jgi:hypothetical protein